MYWLHFGLSLFICIFLATLTSAGRRVFRMGYVEQEMLAGRTIYFFIRLRDHKVTSLDQEVMFLVTVYLDDSMMDSFLVTEADEEGYPAIMPGGANTLIDAPSDFGRVRVFEYIFLSEGEFRLFAQIKAVEPGETIQLLEVEERGEPIPEELVTVYIKWPMDLEPPPDCIYNQSFSINGKHADTRLHQQFPQFSNKVWIKIKVKTDTCYGTVVRDLKRLWTIDRIVRSITVPVVDDYRECVNYRRQGTVDLQKLVEKMTHIPLPIEMTVTGLTIQPYMLPPGFYRICMSVGRKKPDFKVCSFFERTTQDMDLGQMIHMQVTPETFDFVWPMKDLMIDASKTVYVYELPEAGFKGKPTLSFTWSCESEGMTCSEIIMDLTGNAKLASGHGKITIPWTSPTLKIKRKGIDNRAPIYLNITSSVSDREYGEKGSRMVRKIIRFRQKFDMLGIPILDIRCFLNCWHVVNQKAVMLLGLTCANCQELEKQNLSVEWNLVDLNEFMNSTAGDDSMYFSIRDIDKFQVNNFSVRVQFTFPRMDGLFVTIDAIRIFEAPQIQVFHKETLAIEQVSESTCLTNSVPRNDFHFKEYELRGSTSVYPVIFRLIRTDEYRQPRIDDRGGSGGHVLPAVGGTTPVPVNPVETEICKPGMASCGICRDICFEGTSAVPNSVYWSCVENMPLLVCHTEGKMLLTQCPGGALYYPVDESCTMSREKQEVIEKEEEKEVEKKKQTQKTQKQGSAGTDHKDKKPGTVSLETALSEYVVLRTVSFPTDVNLEPHERGSPVYKITTTNAAGSWPNEVSNEDKVQVDHLPYNKFSDMLSLDKLFQHWNAYDLVYLSVFSSNYKFTHANVEEGETKHEMIKLPPRLLKSLCHTNERGQGLTYSNINLFLIALDRFLQSLEKVMEDMEAKDIIEQIVSCVDQAHNVHKKVTDSENDDLLFRSMLIILYSAAVRVASDNQKREIGDMTAFEIGNLMIEVTSAIIDHMPKTVTEAYPHTSIIEIKNGFKAISFWGNPVTAHEDFVLELVSTKLILKREILKQEISTFSIDAFVNIGAYSSTLSPLPTYFHDLKLNLPILLVTVATKAGDIRGKSSRMTDRFDIYYTIPEEKARNLTLERNFTLKTLPPGATNWESEPMLFQVKPSTIYATILTLKTESGAPVHYRLAQDARLSYVFDIFDVEPVTLPKLMESKNDNETSNETSSSIFLPQLSLREDFELHGGSFHIAVCLGEFTMTNNMTKQPSNANLTEPIGKGNGTAPLKSDAEARRKRAVTNEDVLQMECMRVACLQWDSLENQWRGKSCRLLHPQPTAISTQTDPPVVNCRCDDGRVFSGSVGPCNDDLVVDWKEFSITCITCLTSTAYRRGLFYIIIAFWLVFLACLIRSRRIDQRDKYIGMVYLIPRVFSPYLTEQYLVCITTGKFTGSGTTSIPSITLVGKYSNSDEHPLNVEYDEVFRTGGENWFVISTASDIGDLEYIVLSTDQSGKIPTWFVRTVFVRHLPTEKSWFCKCNTWLPTIDKNNSRRFIVEKAITSTSFLNANKRGMFFSTWLYLLQNCHMIFAQVNHHYGTTVNRVQLTVHGFCVFMVLLMYCTFSVGSRSNRLDGDQYAESTPNYIKSSWAAAVSVGIFSTFISILLTKATTPDRYRFLWPIERNTREEYSAARESKIMSVQATTSHQSISRPNGAPGPSEVDGPTDAGHQSEVKGPTETGHPSEIDGSIEAGYPFAVDRPSDAAQASDFAGDSPHTNTSQKSISYNATQNANQGNSVQENIRDSVKMVTFKSQAWCHVVNSEILSARNISQNKSFDAAEESTPIDAPRPRTSVMYNRRISVYEDNEEFTYTLEDMADYRDAVEELEKEEQQELAEAPLRERIMDSLDRNLTCSMTKLCGCQCCLILCTSYLVYWQGSFLSTAETGNCMIIFCAASVVLVLLAKPLLLMLLAFVICRSETMSYGHMRKGKDLAKRLRKYLIPGLKMSFASVVEMNRTVGDKEFSTLVPFHKRILNTRHRKTCNRIVEHHNKRRLMQAQKGSYKDTPIHTALGFIFFVVTVIVVNLQSGSVHDRFMQTNFVTQLLQVGRTYEILNKRLVEEEFWDHLYQKIHLASYNYLHSSTSTATYSILSAVRVMQKRAQSSPGPCHEDIPQLKDLDCLTSVESAVMETRNFANIWSKATETVEEGPFTYNPDLPSFYSFRHTYPAGGYSILFSVRTKRQKVIKYLRGANWVDRNTRVVKVDLVFFNADTKYITWISHAYEFTLSGIWQDGIELYTFPLFYDATSSFLQQLNMLIFLAMTSYFLVGEIRRLYKQGAARFFSHAEEWLNVFERIVCITVIVLYARKAIITGSQEKRVQDLYFDSGEGETYVDFLSVTTITHELSYTCSVLVVSSFIKVMIRTRKIADLRQFLELIASVSQIVWLPLLSLVQFAYLAWLFFVTHDLFMTFTKCLFTIMVLLFRQDIIRPLIFEFPFCGHLFVTLMYCFFNYIVLNFFIIFLNDAFSEIKARAKMEELSKPKVSLMQRLMNTLFSQKLVMQVTMEESNSQQFEEELELAEAAAAEDEFFRHDFFGT